MPPEGSDGRILSWRRLAVFLAAGAAAAVAPALLGQAQLAVLVGWAVVFATVVIAVAVSSLTTF